MSLKIRVMCVSHGSQREEEDAPKYMTVLALVYIANMAAFGLAVSQLLRHAGAVVRALVCSCDSVVLLLDTCCEFMLSCVVHVLLV